MVFESLVVDLLNRFLADYVVNLDTSQLSLGIWGGDAVLENLVLKENALSELDVPFKVKVGHIGKLTLKIPWKNLYKEAVIASLEGVYLLVVPSASIKYDAEKEEKQQLELKQRELRRIEEAMMKAAERENPTTVQADTFTEKLVAQVIKNLQVTVSGIHVRYEDEINNAAKPISVGITLRELSFKTSDQNWKPCLLDDKAKIFYKLVCLDCLSAYWNVESSMYSRDNAERALGQLKDTVASSKFMPKDFCYIFRPISASAKLRMNPKGDVELTMPKINLDVTLQDIDTELCRPQYLSIMEVLESYDLMTRNLPYRKYRPQVPAKGHPRAWWGYVTKGVLEETVRRNASAWSWKHIRLHRTKLRTYCQLYRQKLTQRTAPAYLLEELQELEKDLDVFNITLARQQAEAEAKKSGLKIFGSSLVTQGQEEKKEGWFSGWGWGGWGGGGAKEEAKPDVKDPKSVTQSLSQLMTPEEKAKLFSAIDYSETTADRNIPEDYVSQKLFFKLTSLSCTVRERDADLLKVKVTDVYAAISQRPSAQAFRLDARLEQCWVTGLAQAGRPPRLLTSQGVALVPRPPGFTATAVTAVTATSGAGGRGSLLELMFETNPADKKCDQRLRVESLPLEIVYDAATINSLADFFRPPRDVHLEQLASATMNKLEEFKEKTSTGLAYIIETRKVLELSVDLQASYVVVPYTGSLASAGSLLILDLGHFKVCSVHTEHSKPITVGKTSIKEIMERAYENFNVDLTDVQILYARADDDWKSARAQKHTAMHILQPMSLMLQLASALVTTDARMPKFKVSGELPSLLVSISDRKLRGVVELIDSIPFPQQPKTATPARIASKKALPAAASPQFKPDLLNFPATSMSSRVPSSDRITDSDSEYASAEEEFFDAESSVEAIRAGVAGAGLGRGPPYYSRPLSGAFPAALPAIKPVLKEPPQNMTDLQLQFEIKQIFLEVCCQVTGGQEGEQSGTTVEERPVMQLEAAHLGTELTMRRFNLHAASYLKEIRLSCLEFTQPDGKPINILSTYDNEQEDLLIMKYTKAYKKGPEFDTTFKRTIQKVQVSFSSLDVLLHTEALLFCMNFLMGLAPPAKESDGGAAAAAGAPPPPDVEGDEEDEEPGTVVPTMTADSDSSHELALSGQKPARKVKDDELICFHLEAKLDAFNVCMRSQQHRITDVIIEGLDVNLSQKKTQTDVSVGLKNITVLDADPDTIHKKVVSIIGKEVFRFGMTSYVDATKGGAYTDMAAVDARILLVVGCIQIVYLNKFISALLDFVNNFQQAKEAVTEATVQAAEKAASNLKDLAQRSYRLALSVTVKAPLVVVPRNSKSRDAIVADLGHVAVSNAFSLAPVGRPLPLPPIVDTMTVRLSQIKLSRAVVTDSRVDGEVMMLEPVNMDLELRRNLAAMWYTEIPDVDISAKIRPMMVVLSQDDLMLVMTTLNENLSEGAAAPADKEQPPVDAQKDVDGRKAVASDATSQGEKVVTSAVVETGKPPVTRTTLKFEFNLEAVSLVLLVGTPQQICKRDPLCRLGEFRLQTIRTGGRMMSDGTMAVTLRLHNCTLDDLRPGDKLTARMVGIRPGEHRKAMLELGYRQGREGMRADVTLQDLAVCASIEFLQTVADFFVKGMPAAADAKAPPTAAELTPKGSAIRAAARSASQEGGSSMGQQQVATPPPPSRMVVSVRVRDPEIAFVADLRRAGSPALLASMQLEFDMTREDDGAQEMMAAVRDLKLLACPFVPDQRTGHTTTVLQPCCLLFESKQQGGSTSMNVELNSLTLKVSPVIINAVMSILTALSTPAPEPGADRDADAEQRDPWAVRSLDDVKLWFLASSSSSNLSQLALTAAPAAAAAAAAARDADQAAVVGAEHLEVKVESVTLTLEAGVGHRTIPLLLMEAEFGGDVENWSSLMRVQCQMALEVLYYNEGLAVWEPLLEPVFLEENARWQGTDVKNDKKKRKKMKGKILQVAEEVEQKRWELSVKLNKNAVEPAQTPDEIDALLEMPPETVICVSSEDLMNVTLSKSSIAMLNNLARAFTEAASQSQEVLSEQEDRAPIMVLNCLGQPAYVAHGAGVCSLHAAEGGAVAHAATHSQLLQDGERLKLEYVVGENAKDRSFMERQAVKFAVALVGFSKLEVPLSKAGRYVYSVANESDHKVMNLVCQVDAANGIKTLTLRSPLQIKNHCSVPFRVLIRTSDGEETVVGTAEARGEFNVPFPAYRQDLYVQPAGPGLEGFGNAEMSWVGLIGNAAVSRAVLRCPAAQEGGRPLTIVATTVDDCVTYRCSEEERTGPACLIHLRPPLTLRNLMPFPLSYRLKGSDVHGRLETGHSADVCQASESSAELELSLHGYLGRDWTCLCGARDGQDELSHLSFSIDAAVPGSSSGAAAAAPAQDETLLPPQRQFDAKLQLTESEGRRTAAVFSPYWMLNRTGRMLQYRADDAYHKHPPGNEGPYLFAFKPKVMFNKNKVQLRVSDSDPSSDFSLDTVGSSGCIKCSSKKKMEYAVGVTISLTSFTLTKVVSFQPYFSLANKSRLDVEVSETGSDAWLLVSSNKCVPFWPEDTSQRLQVRVHGSGECSKAFSFTQQDNGTLLQLEGKYVGLVMDVSLGEHSTVISFADYFEGSAPVHLVNHSHEVVAYTQSDSNDERTLQPGQSVLYTWSDPCRKRHLRWTCCDQSYELDLLKDDAGKVEIGEELRVSWACFLDGLQRCLLFTADVEVVARAQDAPLVERARSRIALSLQALGLSLVNDAAKQEISFIGITSSGVVWEEKPKRRWKMMSGKLSALLEERYVKFALSDGSAEAHGRVRIDSDIEVDFTSSPMMLLAPNQRAIRRHFLPGVRVEYTTWPHQTSLRARINRIQIDSQMPGSVFPVVFHPVPPPKSIAADSEPKPLVDVSIVTRVGEHSKITQIKYFKVLIQEMALKADMGFLGALLELVTADSTLASEGMLVKLFEDDLKALEDCALEATAADTSAVSFYEDLHISPLKIHLSFSLSAGGSQDGTVFPGGQAEQGPLRTLNSFLQGIGATLTDLQDVVFRLAFFEVNHKFYTGSQLTAEATRHYTKQALQQMYKVVLGLDVLGNPFGLIHGLSEGVEAFFYEPYQGAVQGPEEFVEGMALGMKSLFGHTVGGAAGMVSRITGTMGKGLATITMDEEYQRKRREEMNQQPTDLKEGLARGGKGLLKGVIGGVTGIITKPIEGARSGGATGFLKGVGKGLVGVVARPAGGVIDMASSTMEGIKRQAEASETVEKMRPPRVIQEDGIIRPYSRREGEGSQLVQKIENGKFALDQYRAHEFVTKDGRNVFLVTNRRVMFVTKDDMFGQVTCDWQYMFNEFTDPPLREGRRLCILANEKLKSVFHVKNIGKILNFPTDSMAEEMLKKLEEAHRKWKEQRFLNSSEDNPDGSD